MNFQSWVGMTNQKTQLVSTVADLVAYRRESDQVLYDLPILGVETIALVRFLPEYEISSLRTRFGRASCPNRISGKSSCPRVAPLEQWS